MSWFKNLFKRKPERLPARDHIGRYLTNGKGEMLWSDSPADEIEKAKTKSLKRHEELLRASLELSIQKKNAEQKKTSTCGCDISIKKCACSSKSAPAKKAPAKSTEKKTAIKSDLAEKPVAKKKPAPKKK